MRKNNNSKFSFFDKLFAHLETLRLYTVIWCGLVSLAGSCLISKGIPETDIWILALFVPMMGWMAGLYLSDFLDRKLDKIEKPHRPIPSGRIYPYEALFVGAVFAGTGLVFSIYLSIYNLILVFVVAFLVLGYAKFTKSRGFIGNLNRGMVTVAAFFYGVFSIDPDISNIPIYIFFLSFVFLFHDTNSNLVGAIRDMRGDKKGGYQTIPVKLGLKNSIIISSVLTVIWLSLMFFSVIKYDFLKIGFYLLIIIDLTILLLLYIYLISSIKNYNRGKALKFHEFFIVERITLASALIIGVTNISFGILIYIFSLIITVTSQYFLRSRYEFQGKYK